MNLQDSSIPDGMVDGATGTDDGGRDPGDVELAIFRRIRSLSNVSGRRILPSSGNGYRRYWVDPLSMFSGQDAPASRSEETSGTVDDISRDNNDIQSSKGSSLDEEDDETTKVQHYMTQGEQWRDAMVRACADLLGKTLPELERDYNASRSVADGVHTAFGERTFEPLPRDFADYAIMTTLKKQDAFSMRNATSWLFNMMDRTGAGYVLRDEFIRYAPYIGPVADAAVAGLVFDELVQEQVRRAEEDEQHPESDGKKEKNRSRDNMKKTMRDAGEGMRRRRGKHSDRQSNSSESHDSRKSQATSDSGVPEAIVRDLYPPAVALKYETWRPFFLAIQDKYQYNDEDWVLVKQQLGINPGELLVKSQGALDHSDLFPTVGKLYLSQRYLVFFAAVGRNHYVARLGAVADVSEASIPIMMRDCIRIQLESEATAAMNGVSALPTERTDENGSKNNGSKRNEGELTLSEHVSVLMRKYSAGRKPLLFSLLEFRETRRRDNWVKLTRELVAAHKLHVELGLGSTGRAVPSLESRHSSPQGSRTNTDAENDKEQKKKETSEDQMLNYRRSPFRNEMSPPLLVVAAHGNIVRYRSLRRVTRKRVSPSLLLFSSPDRNAHLINWYIESVRAYVNQSGKSWVERALAAIRENMDTNDRMYRVEDEEPFDIAILGEAIGRFAELCAPAANIVQGISSLFQWRNPPATILAVLVCVFIAYRGIVNYVPAFVVFFQAAWVVETKYNWLGLGMGRAEQGDAEQRRANVLALVTQVQNTLAAAQNVLGKLNREIGKVQSLFLWGAEDWQSWVAVGALCLLGLVLLIVPSRLLFLGGVFFLFFKHFLPPNNIALQFWGSIPSRVHKRSRESKKSEGRRRRRGAPARVLGHATRTEQ